MLTDIQKEEIETRFKQMLRDGRFMHELTGRENPLKICAWFFKEIDGAVEDEQSRIKNMIFSKYYAELQGDEYAKDPSHNQLIELIIDDISAPPESKIVEPLPSDDELPF